MTFDDAAKEIRSRFDRYVAQLESVPTEYPNAPFQQPPTDRLWARLTIGWGDTNQVTLGVQKRHRTVGVVTVQIFDLVESGDGASLQLADKIKKLFRSTTVNGITWRTPSLASIGRDGQWWQTNVSCPFYFDDVDEV